MNIRDFVKKALADTVAKAKTVFASKEECPQIIDVTDGINSTIKQKVLAAPNSLFCYDGEIYTPVHSTNQGEPPTAYARACDDEITARWLFVDWSNYTMYDEATCLVPKNNAQLTGTPKAPTATAGTNTTQIATTAFVQTAISSKADKSSTVTNVSYNSSTGQLQKTINETTSNITPIITSHQSAFAAVSVLDTYINASQPGDSIAILPGNNVTITPDAANKRITISATDTNTHRTIEVGGQEVLGNNTTPLSFLGGGGVDISYDGANGMQITGPGSKSSSSGSNELSMVTRGEKYTWNSKMSSGDTIHSTKVTYLTVSTFAATISSSEQATVIIGNQPATGQARSITLPGQPGDGRCFRFYHIQGNPTFYAEQVTTAYGTGRATFKLFRSDVTAVSDQESFSVNDKGLVVEFVFCQSMGNFGTWLVHHSMIY